MQGPRHPSWPDRKLAVERLGRLDYDEAVALQRNCVETRRTGGGDVLLLVEHPPVITAGSGGGSEHILEAPEALAQRGVAIRDSGRGGDVTFHGPGQVVGYPILDLKPDRKDLHAYLRALERVVIRALQDFGIVGRQEPPLTGVWVDGAKVAALGIRVSSGWITSHGFALNVSTDLTFFDLIVPCGIRGRSVTSLEALLNRPISLAETGDALVRGMVEEFGYGDVSDSGGWNS